MIAFSPFCSSGEQRLEVTAACLAQPPKATSLRAAGRIKLLPEMISQLPVKNFYVASGTYSSVKSRTQAIQHHHKPVYAVWSTTSNLIQPFPPESFKPALSFVLNLLWKKLPFFLLLCKDLAVS